MDPTHAVVAIVPCTDLDASQAFYERLGFRATSIFAYHGYRILHDAGGASLHLTHVAAGGVDPASNGYGVYFYTGAVVELAARMGVAAETKPWGVIEFAVSDPSGTQVRVGWPVAAD